MPVLHVIPLGDEIEHDTASGDPDCVCGPRMQPVQHDDGSMNWLLVHHSLDGREQHETEA